ncbi:MAG: autotransporter-associated beta strand repeat-containing protein, partial [Verrucomicrobia bacterium]|nr:autotransporter-associated beta strand repeat-containing protein [Verrucomicrobiota bacterium]
MIASCRSKPSIFWAAMLCAALLLWAMPSSAADVYWDIDGPTSGPGGSTPSGAWNGVNTFWNTDAAGGAGSLSADPGSGNRAVLSAGSQATGPYTLTLSGSRTVGGIHFKDGSATLSGGTLVMSGDLDQSSAGVATIESPINLNGAARTMTVGSGGMSINAVISNGGITKNGTGTLTLNGNNIYDSITVVEAGTLVLTGDNSGAAGSSRVMGGATVIATEAKSLPPGTTDMRSRLELRNDASTVFDAPGHLSFGAQDTGGGTIFVDRAIGGSGSNQTHTVTKVTSAGSRTVTVDGAHGYSLTMGTYEAGDGNNNYITALVDLNINTFNPSKMLPLRVSAGVTVTVGTTVNSPHQGPLNIVGPGTVIFNGPMTPGNNQTWTISSGLALFNGTMSVNGTARVNANGGTIGGTGTILPLTYVDGAGGIDLRDGAISSLTLSDLTFNNTTDKGLYFDLGANNLGTDTLIVNGDLIMQNGAEGNVLIHLDALGSPISDGTSTLIDGTGAMPPHADFVLGANVAFGKIFALQKTGSDLELVVSSAPAGPASPRWTGASSTAWNVGGNWVGAAIPGFESNVEFYNAGAGNLSTVLNQDFDINSLTYLATAVASTTIAKGIGNILVIEAGTANGNTAGNGITVHTPNSGAPIHTISTPVALVGDQIWTVHSNARLAVPAPISEIGSARSLTKEGGGTLTVYANGTTELRNSFTGGTIVNAGTLELGRLSGNPDYGSLRGTVTVNAGATLDYVTENTFGYNSTWQINELNIVGGTVGGADFGNHFWNSFVLNMTGGILKLGGTGTGQGGNEFQKVTINVNPSASQAVIETVSGEEGIDVRGEPLTFNVADGAQEVDLLVDVAIFEDGGDTLIKQGAGTMALSKASNMGDSTTISEGVLQLGNGGTSGSLNPKSSIVNNGVLAFDRSNTLTQGVDFGDISGPGGVRQRGSGTTFLTSANAFTGITTIEDGVLNVGRWADSGVASAIGTGSGGGALALVINGGTLQHSGAGALSDRLFSIGTSGATLEASGSS